MIDIARECQWAYFNYVTVVTRYLSRTTIKSTLLFHDHTSTDPPFMRSCASTSRMKYQN